MEFLTVLQVINCSTYSTGSLLDVMLASDGNTVSQSVTRTCLSRAHLTQLGFDLKVQTCFRAFRDLVFFTVNRQYRELKLISLCS